MAGDAKLDELLRLSKEMLAILSVLRPMARLRKPGMEATVAGLDKSLARIQIKLQAAVARFEDGS